MDSSKLSAEEQLEDLQRRFQLLEGERKATYIIKVFIQFFSFFL